MPADPVRDLGGGEVPREKQQFIKYQLDTARDVNTFRRSLFWLTFILIVAYYGALLYFIFCRTWQEIGTERIAIAALIGAIPTILVLALARRIFSPMDKQEKDSDSVSIWQELAKELIEI